MIFGKYINRYYLRSAPVLLLGLLALLTVDYIQLMIPELYRLVINGVNLGEVVIDGQTLAFTKEVLFQHICLPMIWIVLLMVVGRFLWRVCFFGSAVLVTADLRERMFDHSRQLSQQYYQVNKVGNLMSLYTNDLDTIQECFGDGILMFFDASVLGLLALFKMWRMDYKLTLLALIPAAHHVRHRHHHGHHHDQNGGRKRQQAFSDLSDFAQENFSGIAVIKAFVKELQGIDRLFVNSSRENEEINVHLYQNLPPCWKCWSRCLLSRSSASSLGYGGWLVYRGRVQRGPAGGVHRLLRGHRLAHHGHLDAHRKDLPRQGVPQPRHRAAGRPHRCDRPGRCARTSAAPKGGIEFRHLTFRYPDGEYRCAEGHLLHRHPRRERGHRGQDRRRQDGAGRPAAAHLQRARRHPVSWTGRTSTASPSTRCGSACAYVPQDNFLFSDTIAHNIAFGVDDATPEDIERAASLG